MKERKKREKDTLEDNDASSNLHSVPLCKSVSVFTGSNALVNLDGEREEKILRRVSVCSLDQMRW